MISPILTATSTSKLKQHSNNIPTTNSTSTTPPTTTLKNNFNNFNTTFNTKASVRIGEDSTGDVILFGAASVQVKDEKELLRLLEKAAARR